MHNAVMQACGSSPLQAVMPDIYTQHSQTGPIFDMPLLWYTNSPNPHTLNLRQTQIPEPQVWVQICAVATSAFAEFAIVPEAAALKLPQGADLATSAGLPVAFGTAHVALAHRAGLRAGQTVLILGAAGGVGMAAVQVIQGSKCRDLGLGSGVLHQP